MMNALATFEVDVFEEIPVQDPQKNIPHQHVHIKKTFRGDLEGQSEVAMLGVRNEEGSGYVALERISGMLHERSGSFSLLHIGTIDGADKWGRWLIVPGSGTGELEKICGEGRIERNEEGQHIFTLEYELTC